VLPIFILITLGFALSKKFSMDTETLTKLNFYLYSPAFTFVYIFSTEVTVDLVRVILLALTLLVVNYAAGAVITRLLRLKWNTAKAFQNALMFFNSGNIGVSLIILVFSRPPYVVDGSAPYLQTALSVQIMLFLVQNLTMSTIGFINSGGEGFTLKKGVTRVLQMPMIYAAICAFLFKLLPFDFTGTPFWPALSHLRDGLVSIALVSLGVQLAKSRINLRLKTPYLAAFCRLVGGPAVAYLLIRLFGFEGVMAQAIFISVSAPTAVNTALISVECKGDSDFAVQAVTVSTLLSAVTMTVVVYLAYTIF